MASDLLENEILKNVKEYVLDIGQCNIGKVMPYLPQGVIRKNQCCFTS